MARRTILTEGDETLRKKSRPVTVFDARLKTLVDDMFETMEANRGVGLAAPQVGLLRRLFVMDVGDGPVAAINPELSHYEGEQEELEGCLSLPGLFGVVKRPERVRLTAEDVNGERFSMDLEGLGAICACHETDHLNGILFRDIAEGELFRPEALEQMELDEDDD